MTTPLQTAAQAVIARWDTSHWKSTRHTAEYIADLRKALEAEQAQVVACGYDGMVGLCTSNPCCYQATPPAKSFAEVHPANPAHTCKCEHWKSCAECHPTAHPAPPATSDRAELIAQIDALFTDITPLPWFGAADGRGVGLSASRWTKNGGFADVTKDSVLRYGGSPITNTHFLAKLANSWPTIRDMLEADAPFAPDWAGYRQGVKDGKAEAQQVAVPAPLSNSEIDSLGVSGIKQFPTLFNQVPWGSELKAYVRQLARAIEAHHKIGAKP